MTELCGSGTLLCIAIALLHASTMAVLSMPVAAQPLRRAAVTISVDLRAYPHPSDDAGRSRNTDRGSYEAVDALRRYAPPESHVEVRVFPGSTSALGLFSGATEAEAMQTCERVAAQCVREGPRMHGMPDRNVAEIPSAVSVTQACHLVIE